MNFVAFLDCFILFLYYVLTPLQTFLHHAWYQKHYQNLFRTGLSSAAFLIIPLDTYLDSYFEALSNDHGSIKNCICRITS